MGGEGLEDTYGNEQYCGVCSETNENLHDNGDGGDSDAAPSILELNALFILWPIN